MIEPGEKAPAFTTLLADETAIPSLPLSLAISDFKTTVNKIALPATGKSAAARAKGKKQAKKKQPPQALPMATCSTGTVTFRADDHLRRRRGADDGDVDQHLRAEEGEEEVGRPRARRRR